MIAMAIAALLLSAVTPAIHAQSGRHVLVAGPVVARTLTYGKEPRQAATLFTREGARRAPLIVYLHGGGWSAGSPRDGSRGAQTGHWTRNGYAYATVGYRYVPAATAEDQLRDVAQAIALLRRQAGVDGSRIALIGHSSGGTMAAQLGTDPNWLEKAGVPFTALKGVVLLDPSVLDIPPVMAQLGAPIVERYLRPAFGDDPVRQSELSPVKHVEPPNAPAWAIVADANNGFASAQGSDFAAGLIGAGASAKVIPIAGTTHMRINNEIGQRDDRATAEIDAFFAGIFPEVRRPRFR